ncbi:MAG: SDR family oxidoreductase [Bacillota bacterium]
MATYLVTGGAGFIGSHLVEELIRRVDTVRVLDDFSTGKWENLLEFHGKFELFVGSVTDLDVCRKAVRGVDYVLHQAALGSVPRSVEDPITTHRVNVDGTVNILWAAKEAGVRRVVLAGSSSSYGDTPVLPKVEDMPARPRSPYAVSKYAIEHYARVFAELYGLSTLVLRYFNVFGPRQNADSQYAAVIPRFVSALLTGGRPVIFGDGEQTRDFTYVKDCVQANLLAAAAEGVDGEVFNVAGGRRVSINHVYQEIASQLGSDVQPKYKPPRHGDVRDSLASIEKARLKLGCEPRYSLADGLAETIAWYRSYFTTAGRPVPFALTDK